MDAHSKVVIVLGKCSQSHKFFGIRFEGRPSLEANLKKSFHFKKRDNTVLWRGTWAFPLKEDSASREGYDRDEIRGSINLDAGYPGCPHCKKRSIVKCGCGKVACSDGVTLSFKCPWCRNTGTISGQIETLNAEADC